MTVSKAAERSSRMRTDDLESAFATRRASVTESSAVSVEWPLLKPDCLASSLLYCERNSESWLKTTRSSVFATNGRRENKHDPSMYCQLRKQLCCLIFFCDIFTGLIDWILADYYSKYRNLINLTLFLMLNKSIYL